MQHMHSTQSKSGSTLFLLQDIPEGLWKELTTDFFTYQGKEHLLICNTFSKYPFIYKASYKTPKSIQVKFKQLVS